MQKITLIGFALAVALIVPTDACRAQARQQNPGPATQQPAPPPGRRDLSNASAFAGRYRCIWTSPDGFVYECELQLRNTSATEVDGRIQWTLIRSPRPGEQAKLGMSGAELVRGALDGPGKVNISGYDKVDPNGILGLDEYKLELSGTARWIFGTTSNHGDWNAQFYAVRLQ